MQINTFNGQTIEANISVGQFSDNLIALPAIIDPHVHFRVPGGEHKEDWISGARAAIAGGVTTVLDMPNNTPSITTAELLENKKAIIDAQLKAAGIPLHYKLYIGATADNLEEIRRAKNDIAGIKVFMGASTGNLLVDKLADQEKIFKLAGELGLVVAIHAEDDTTINKKQLTIGNPTVADHSVLRSREAAMKAVTKAIALSKKFKTKTYFLHVSTKEEVDLVRAAKKDGVPVFAEATPHHLFLNTDAYNKLGTKAQMNPPLREPADQEALWAGILDGTIDCIGTDHAPHTIEEKAQPYPKSPSGVPGIETALPLLLNACHEGKISLEKIVELTSANPRKIFNPPRRQVGLPKNNDWVIVDLDLTKTADNKNLKTKCGWSPFEGWKLTGWPVATILDGKIYNL